jgi:hypothetical protein
MFPIVGGIANAFFACILLRFSRIANCFQSHAIGEKGEKGGRGERQAHAARVAAETTAALAKRQEELATAYAMQQMAHGDRAFFRG